jgi:hypothetical protein
MNDLPPRLRDQSTDRVKRLLEDARRDGPSPEEVASVVAAATAGATLTASRGLFTTTTTLKILGAIGAAGLVVAGAIALRTSRHPAAETIAPQPQLSASVEVPQAPDTVAAAAVTSETAPAPTAPTPSAVHTVTRPAPTIPKEDDALELKRVVEIRSRVLAKDATGALTGVERYERDYPHGSFIPEAEAMAIDALVQSDRTEEAIARADRFLARYGSSPQAVRIRALSDQLKRKR